MAGPSLEFGRWPRGKSQDYETRLPPRRMLAHPPVIDAATFLAGPPNRAQLDLVPLLDMLPRPTHDR